MEKLGHPVLLSGSSMSVPPPLTVFRCLPQILALQ